MRPTCDLPDTDCTFLKQAEYPFGSLYVTNSWLSRFFSLTFAIFILCSMSVSQPYDRPETGTYIRDMHRDGYGLLVIYNNWTMDTVAVLTDKKVKPKLAVYLRAKDALEVSGIEDGEYGLYFTIGDGWNAGEGKFDKVYGYYRYNTPMAFETKDVGEEIEYTILELDLYKADATNFMPDQFQFPDISS
jgi:hypothetical protein